MANYTSHTDKTLHYMERTLMRIDKTKKTFWDTHYTDAQICDNGPGYFNFSKWYTMSHYLQLICLFGSAVGYTIRVEEAWHITWLKQFFK